QADVQGFLFMLGLFSFGLVLLAAVCRIATIYAINRFTNMRQHSLSERLLETYLRKPYSFFLDRHSGDMAKNVLSEVDQVLALVLLPGLHLLAYSVVALALVGLLLALDPLIALCMAGGVGLVYAVIYLSVRG